jgi:glycosyltransferase involved in cell wall biosynthesis
MEITSKGDGAGASIGNSAKLLSICILSYNQAEEVERILDCLVHQYTDEIEIVIKDDSTDDKTELLVNRFSKVVPIRYFRGVKEGIDKTVIFLTQKAEGKFVWWMGDDTVEPGGVAAVVDVIKSKPSVNFIWANYQLHNTKNLGIDIAPRECFIEKNQLLVLGGAGLGFISSTVFSRVHGLQSIDSASKYIGSFFTNLYMVLHVITQPGDCYYIKGPVVICHPATSKEIMDAVIKDGGMIKNEAFQVFGINFSKIVREFSESFESQIIRQTLKNSFAQTWRGVLVGTVGGWDTTTGKGFKLIRNFWMFPESSLAFVLFLMPRSIVVILYSLYKSIRDNKIISNRSV